MSQKRSQGAKASEVLWPAKAQYTSKDVPKLRGIHLLIKSSKLGSTGLSKSQICWTVYVSISKKAAWTSMANAILNPNLSKDSFSLTNLDFLCWRFSHCAWSKMALVFLPCCLSMTNNERATRLNDIRQLPCLQQAKYRSETYKRRLAQIAPFIAPSQTARRRLAKFRIEQDCPLSF